MKTDGLSDLSRLQPDREGDKGWTYERFYCCPYSKMSCDSHMGSPTSFPSHSNNICGLVYLLYGEQSISWILRVCNHELLESSLT